MTINHVDFKNSSVGNTPQEEKQDRFKEVLGALLNQPLGKELINLMKDRLVSAQAFTADSPAAYDKFVLGRHSVYKEMIKVAEELRKPKPQKENKP